jgi:hypothetical protein
MLQRVMNHGPHDGQVDSQSSSWDNLIRFYGRVTVH